MKPSKSATTKAQFSIEMDIKGLVIFLSVAVLTGATIFYLGLTYGKASRNANHQSNLGSLDPAEMQLKPPKNLKIYDLGQKKTQLNHLQSEFDRIKTGSNDTLTQETLAVERDAAELKQIKAQSQKITFKNRPSPSNSKKKKKIKSEVKGVSWPDIVQDTNGGKKEILYTIQILTTSRQSKAEKLIKMLKNKGFSAYINRINPQGTQLYRVRVAKVSKRKIQAIKPRLNQVIQGLGPVRVVQIR